MRSDNIRSNGARRLAGLTLLALPLALALRGDTAIADAPRTLASAVPTGAVAVVETDDLRALLDRWRTSQLHKDYAKSAVAKELEKSRLYLRLERNVEELEEVAGFSLTLDKLAKLAGHRSALALYDVPSTSFVLVSELRPEEARVSTLFGQKGRMQPREHRGVPYLLQEGAKGKASLAVALVGDRLIAGTDLEAFRGTLVLAAKAAGVAVKPPATGQAADPAPLASDATYRELVGAAPQTPISIWVGAPGLSGHYFDDYWIFGAGTGKGLRAAWLSLAPGTDVTVETRIYLYQDGARPSVARDDQAHPGTSDVVAHAAALPTAPPFAAAGPADADDAAEAIVDMLPLPTNATGGGKAPDEEARAAVARVLTAVAPRCALEVLEPSTTKGAPVADHHAAIAIALGSAASFDGTKLEQALAAALAPRLASAGATLAFSDDNGGRALRLPLVPEWSLTWRRAGDVLIVATDGAAADRMAKVVAADGAKLLAAQGPRALRLDVGEAASLWRGTLKTLAPRQNWYSSTHADLYSQSIGGLFGMLKDTKRVVAYGYARGNAEYVEEVQYRGK